MARANVKKNKKDQKQPASSPKAKTWAPKTKRPKGRRKPGEVAPEELERQRKIAQTKLAEGRASPALPATKPSAAKPKSFGASFAELKRIDDTFQTPEETVLALHICGMPDRVHGVAIRKRPLSYAAVARLKTARGWVQGEHSTLRDICPDELWAGLIDRALDLGRQIIEPEIGGFLQEYARWREFEDRVGGVRAVIPEEVRSNILDLKRKLPKRHVSPTPIEEPSVERIEAEVAGATDAAESADGASNEACGVKGCGSAIAADGYRLVGRGGDVEVSGLCGAHLNKVRRVNPSAEFHTRAETEAKLADSIRDDEALAEFMVNVID